jgi:flagellar protein FlaJ
MATETTPGDDTSAFDTVESLRLAYDHFEMRFIEYLFRVLLPSGLLLVVAVGAVLLLQLPLMVEIPTALLGLLAVVVAVLYPKLEFERERREMENNLHLVITHMTVLSTTNIDRMEVFRTLAEEDEYGALATELHRVTELVDTWNQSLDDACRIRAKRAPSKHVSDFLDRLAYSMGAGQELRDFLVSEQSAIIQEYETVYQGALDNLEVMKDLYLSMILSMTFALVFAVVLPVLTGTDPTMTVAAIIVVYIFVQVGFFTAIRAVAPDDPVWYLAADIPTGTQTRIKRTTLAGLGLAAVVALAVVLDLAGLLTIPLPTPIKAVLPTTPLLLPGIAIRSSENAVKARDKEFPSFIRALGASESAKQSTSGAVLAELRTKDFGLLTANIDDLYRRLNMRISPSQAWRHFTAECHSHLIQKFSEMYLIGRQMGGEPKQLGELISENLSVVLRLRDSRKQSTVTLIGLLYGITAASSFAFFVGLQVVNLLTKIITTLDTPDLDIGSLISTGAYDIPLIQGMLLVIVLFNAALSALMIRTVDGGHTVNASMHFVLLSWIGALVAGVTKWVANIALQV